MDTTRISTRVIILQESCFTLETLAFITLAMVARTASLTSFASAASITADAHVFVGGVEGAARRGMQWPDAMLFVRSGKLKGTYAA